MSQDTTRPVSPEDRQFLQDHELGLPLKIYRVKEREIRYVRYIAWPMIIISLLSLSLLTPLDFRNWQHMLVLIAQHPQDRLEIEIQYNQPFLFFRYLFSMGSFFLVGLFLLLLRVPSLKKRRVIVCEYGLLQVRGVIRERQETLHWEDIQTITHDSLLYRKDTTMKRLRLNSAYQGLDELMAQIKQQTDKIG